MQALVQNSGERDSGAPEMSQPNGFNALALALCMMASTALIWLSIAIFGISNFPDIENYRKFFEGGYYVFILQRMSWFEYLSSEASWSSFVDFFIVRNFDVYQILFISSVISLGFSLYFVYMNCRNPAYFLFFVNPLSMDLYVGQNRSALASGLFLFALTLKNPVLRIVAMLFAGTFHISIFILMAVYFAHAGYVKLNEHFQNTDFRRRLWIAAILILAFAFAFGRSATLYQLNDSRADTETETSTWTYVSFWATLLVNYVIVKKEDFSGISPTIFLFCYMEFILFTYTGSFSSRWAAYAIPFIAVCSQKIEGIGKEFFYIHFFLVSLVAYVYWVGQAQFI